MPHPIAMPVGTPAHHPLSDSAYSLFLDFVYQSGGRFMPVDLPLTASTLADYPAAILGLHDVELSPGDATALQKWLHAGGRLLLFAPTPLLPEDGAPSGLLWKLRRWLGNGTKAPPSFLPGVYVRSGRREERHELLPLLNQSAALVCPGWLWLDVPSEPS